VESRDSHVVAISKILDFVTDYDEVDMPCLAIEEYFLHVESK
jgi:hypothetical protein